jgi:DNA-binding MarR family transcriptional regulator
MQYKLLVRYKVIRVTPDNDTGKAHTIDEIISLQERLSRVFIDNAFEHWQRLAVPMAQLKSLFIIANRSGTNSRTLARYLDVTQGNVTGIVGRLVQQGLVTRAPSPEDRRIIILQATEKGRGLLTDLIEDHSKHMVSILARLSHDELSSLRHGLHAFVRAVEGYQSEFGGGRNDAV